MLEQHVCNCLLQMDSTLADFLPDCIMPNLDGKVDAVVFATGTGGTLSGILGIDFLPIRDLLWLFSSCAMTFENFSFQQWLEIVTFNTLQIGKTILLQVVRSAVLIFHDLFWNSLFVPATGPSSPVLAHHDPCLLVIRSWQLYIPPAHLIGHWRAFFFLYNSVAFEQVLAASWRRRMTKSRWSLQTLRWDNIPSLKPILCILWVLHLYFKTIVFFCIGRQCVYIIKIRVTHSEAAWLYPFFSDSSSYLVPIISLLTQTNKTKR